MKICPTFHIFFKNSVNVCQTTLNKLTRHSVACMGHSVEKWFAGVTCHFLGLHCVKEVFDHLPLYAIKLPFDWSKKGQFCLRVCPKVPFYWKLFKIGIRSAKDIRKDEHIFQIWGSALATPRPPVSRVVLEHTEPSGQTLIGGSVHFQTVHGKFYVSSRNAKHGLYKVE